MARRSRIRILGAAALVTLVCGPPGCGAIYKYVGGDFAGPPGQLELSISPAAKELMRRAFRGFENGGCIDAHVHAVGLGTEDNGIYINPTWVSLWHPIKRARTKVYLSAAGVSDTERADRDYIERLVELARQLPPATRLFLYAQDWFHDENGRPDPERTSFRVPNEYVHSLAREFAEIFVPVISIHPHRADALEALEIWADQGVRFVKWLPNAMGIDPSAERLTPFYREMIARDMVLLTHTGDELAVDAEDLQHLGNPLLLRRPLDLGLRVIALHAAGRGSYEDVDRSGRPLTPGFDLFLRLMDDPRYEGLLFGETASLTFFTHPDRTLRSLLERRDLHSRFLHGSDYPLPGINFLTRTSDLRDAGFITEEERGPLNEIYRYNPLLFDFVLKRTVRHPETRHRLDDSVFRLPPELEAAR